MILDTFRLILLFLISIPCLSLKAQDIRFEDIPLQWSDFKSAKSFGSRHAMAHVSYALEYQMHSKENILDYTTNFRILPLKSWVDHEKLRKQSPENQERLLNHERGHLVIGLIYYQELQSAFQEEDFQGNVKRQMRKVFNRIYRKMRRFNKRYDKKTEHGVSAAAQRVWQKRLLKTLNTHYDIHSLQTTLQSQ